MIELDNLGEDDYGPFAQVCVTLENQKRTVRWGLDSYTYISMRFCARQLQIHSRSGQPTDSAPVSFQLSLTFHWRPLHRQYVSSITEVTGTTPPRSVEFPCSSLYVANLQWLRSVSKLSDFDDATFMDEELVHRAAVPLIGRHEVASTISQPESDGQRGAPSYPVIRRRATLGALVGVVCIAGIVYGDHIFKQPKTTATLTNGPSNSSDPSSEPAKPSQSAKPVQPSSPAASSQPSSQPAGASDGSTSAVHSTVWSVPQGDVALVFSGGPSMYTLPILKILQQNHVQATFFFTGERITDWKDSVIAVARAGDEVGDGSMTRPLLTSLPADLQKSQIENTRIILDRLVSRPVTLFQPPYEAYNETTDALVAQAGLTLALWNRDPKDWAADSPATIVSNIASSQASGGVYTLNELPNTVAALNSVIQNLKNQHLTFVTLP